MNHIDTKTLWLSLLLIMSMFTTKAYAHDIEVQNADGKTIYYVWTNNNTELAVSYNGKTPRDTPGDYTDEYSGIVVIPASVTYNGNTYSVISIGSFAFHVCTALTSVVIPNSVTSIDLNAFSGCTGLTSIVIPNSVTSIGAYAFYDSTGLISVVSEIQKPFEIGETVFEYYDYDTRSNKFTSATLYVPQGTKEEYLATPAWNLFGENIVEMDKLSGIKSALNGETEKIENFDLDGHRLDALKKGLNIIRMSDGTIKKVVIK